MNKEKIVAILPIALYLIGFLTHNLYLSSYGTYDFEILKAKYIYSGILTTIYFMATATLVSIKTNLSLAKENFKFWSLTAWATRTVTFTFITYSILDSNQKLLDPEVFAFLGESYSSKIEIGIAFFFTFILTFITIDTFGNISEKDVAISNVLNRFFSYLSFLILPISILISLNNVIFRSVFLLYLFMGGTIISFVFGRNDAQEGIYVDTLDTKTNRNIHLTHTLIFSITIFAIASILVLKLFATNIYPIIPSSYGGSKPIHAKIKLEKQNMKVAIINENPTWIIVMPEDSFKIVRLKTKDVKQIEINVKK